VRRALDCGEARFTALGETPVACQLPIPFPARMNPASPGTADTAGGTSQPLKAAVARRSPKDLTAA